MSREDRITEIINETKAAIDNAIEQANNDIAKMKGHSADFRQKADAARKAAAEKVDQISRKAYEDSKEHFTDAKEYMRIARDELKKTNSADKAIKAVMDYYKARAKYAPVDQNQH